MEQKRETYDFTYVFSAEQQEEVRKIYEKYSTSERNKKMHTEEEEKMEKLRRLDKSVTQWGNLAVAGSVTAGAVIHGVGTALIQNEDLLFFGTVIALAGLMLFLAAYSIHGYAMKIRRRKVEAQILKLCKELMK